MNSFRLFLYPHLSIFLVVFQLSCSPALVNLDSAKSEVTNYYESGQYEKELTEIINDAKDKFSKVELVQSSAVVFDVDETTLDNYKAIKQIGYGYERKYWNEWVEMANAPTILQVKELYDFLVRKGFKIIFITGRRDNQYNPTLANIKSAGYTVFDTLIIRKQDDHKNTAADFKAQKRKELAEKGYVIAGCVGDQLTDCDGENCGIVVKLPNYLYLVE